MHGENKNVVLKRALFIGLPKIFISYTISKTDCGTIKTKRII